MMYDEEDRQESLAEQQAKKLMRDKARILLKKGAKFVAKLAAKAALAIFKALFVMLNAIGWPFILIVLGILAAVFIIYLATTLMFSDLDDSELPEDARRLKQHIVAEADATVDMSRPEQIPYRVPHELIAAALQIYESEEKGQTHEQAAHTMAQGLKPIFEYKELEGTIVTEETTCTDGQGCSTSTTTTKFPIIMLERVDAWDRIMTAVFTPVSNTETSSYSGSTTDAEGNTISTSTTVVVTVNTWISDETIVIDYTHFDRILSTTPFDYGQNDRLMVEALYQATGNQISYTEWLLGNDIYGFDGTIIPGNSVPSEFMEYYLEAEKKYGVPWYYLAAIHYVETSFSTHSPMISSVGAEGHMQFMPCTWLGWSYSGCKGSNGYVNVPDSIKHDPLQIKIYGGYGVDADGDGKADPFNIKDAIFSAAKYLNAHGINANVDKAILAYNKADWYVKKVKDAANKFKHEAMYTPDSGNIPPLAPGSFMKPAIGRISSGFGYRTLDGGREFHAGVDIANSAGTSIVATADGVVSKVSTGCPPVGNLKSNCGGQFGNYVFINHNVEGQNFFVIYAHMSKVVVTQGQSVKQGQLIGLMGSSGRSSGSHLHFEIHKGSRQGKKNLVNPSLLVPL